MIQNGGNLSKFFHHPYFSNHKNQMNQHNSQEKDAKPKNPSFSAKNKLSDWLYQSWPEYGNLVTTLTKIGATQKYFN